MLNTLYVVPDQNEEHLSAPELAELFSRECGIRPLPYMQRAFAQFLQEGFEPLMLQEVIFRTAMAPRPSWAYLDAILRNCRSEGIFDYVKFMTRRHDVKRHDWPI